MVLKYPHAVQDRQRELIELAKALREEGQEGSLVKTISKFTTFSEQYVRILPDEYKQESMAREIAELSSATEQSPRENLENRQMKRKNLKFYTIN